MSYPTNFGQPCWSAEQVSKVITQTVEAKAQTAPHFLASHSPFRKISDFRTPGQVLTEDDVFQDIFSKSRGEVQAFVKGEPGTGKSHLIRWLKLRSDYAAAHRDSGLDKFKLVLVERGTGSLKDALQQIVVQLGPEFERHIERVRGAIEKLSTSTARATLLSELALEVEQRWSEERQRPPLPRGLAHLGQALRAKGFGRWLQRDDGVVDLIIRRLTEQSTVEQRESFPKFTVADFDVPPIYLRADENSQQVIVFSDDLKEESALPEIAAETLNNALRDAIRELTGLRGSNLLDIFVEIRRELKRQRKQLAIFIEDVSVTGLDQDVVNAFEPRAGEHLCRMVAVLGITNNGWDRMPDNQRQRGTQVFEVGGNVVAQWASDTEEVARFTARYLNAVRLTDAEISTLANERFNGDIQRSKCDRCPHRQPCHAAFGKIELEGGVAIGMFPFSKHAPQALLGRLDDVRYKSQRGLLVRVLLPALDQSHSAFVNHEFPRPSNFSVQRHPLSTWTGFENGYCGGGHWDSESKDRLKFLAQFWVSEESSEELASQLQPLLGPLGLPKFSRTTTTPVAPKPTGGTKPTEQPKSKPKEDPELLKLLECLDAWSAGQSLKQDGKFRELLGKFLKESICWEDFRGIPITETKRLVQGRSFPRIEGQTDRPASQTFFIDFSRDAEIRDLLQSLVQFDRTGRSSWDFEHGELHKRILSRWLRKNRARVTGSLQPQPVTLTENSVRCASQVLALSAFLRDRSQFPEGRVERLKKVVGPIWEGNNRPVALSQELETLIADLEQKHAGIRKLLVQELGAGQGRADPDDFLDPLPILKALEDFESNVKVESLPSGANDSFWKSRFLAVANLNAYGTLVTRLEKEREALRTLISQVECFIRECGCERSDVRQGLKVCLEQLIETVELQRGKQRKPGILPLPNPPFDTLWEQKLIQQRGEVWGTALVDGSGLEKNGSDGKLLSFDPRRLTELAETLGTARNHLELIEKHLQEEEEALDKRGAGSSRDLLDELKKLSAFAIPSAGQENDS